jgi:cobalt/nickel transport system permease protein
MLGVHLVIGLMEGLLTSTILAFLQQVRPDILIDHLPGHIRWGKRTVLVTLLGMTILIAGVLSLLASENPDGLEWSYANRPNQPDFIPMTSTASDQVQAVDTLQSRYSLFPDYSIRGAGPGDHENVPAAWTSFAGVLGSVLTMGCIWLCAVILRKKSPTPDNNDSLTITE